MASRSPQLVIAQLMNENTSILSGAGMAQDEMSLDPNMTDADARSPEETTTVEIDQELDPNCFSEKELKLGKRFIELAGGAERARDLINKCDEGMEFLGLVDDADTPTDDDEVIRQMAGLMPVSPDMPNGVRNSIDITQLYNPDGLRGGYQ